MDEAQELARLAFHAAIADHLTVQDISELRAHGTISARTPSEGWEFLIGQPPEPHLYYEVELYRPSDKCPYIEKSFARMLVPRDRSSTQVHFI